MERNSTQKEQ